MAVLLVRQHGTILGIKPCPEDLIAATTTKTRLKVEADWHPDRLVVLPVPNITNALYGRDVGYAIGADRS
jgi:hypothetical protein